MQYADRIIFGLEQISLKFDEVCSDYNQVLNIQKQASCANSAQWTAMACAVLNPIAKKYHAQYNRIGVESLAMPDVAVESIGDILETIGKAIMAVIESFWDWLKSFFDGRRNSKGGSGGGGSNSERKEREAKVEKYKKDDETRKRVKAKPRVDLKPEEKEKYKSRGEILTQRMEKHIMAFSFLNPSFKQKDLMEHLKECSTNVDKLVELMAKSAPILKSSIQLILKGLEDAESGKAPDDGSTLENMVAPISQGAIDSMSNLYGGFDKVKHQAVIGQITINHHGVSQSAKTLLQATRAVVVVAFLIKSDNPKKPTLLTIKQFSDGTKEEAESKAIKFTLDDQSMLDYASEFMVFSAQKDIYESAVHDYSTDIEPEAMALKDKISEFLKGKKQDKTTTVEFFRVVEKVTKDMIHKTAALVMVSQHLSAIARDHAAMLDIINDAHNLQANDPDIKLFV